MVVGEKVIGRVYTVHPSAGEVFYLRTLLHHLTGRDLALADAPPADRAAHAFTFEALKYFRGVLHESYQAACEARGLLQDDKEWFDVLDDARFNKMPRPIRELFVYILRFNSPRNPAALLDEFWRAMADDFEHEMKRRHVLTPDATLRARVLLDLEERLEAYGESLAKHQLPFTLEERELAAEVAQTMAWCDEPKEILDELTPPDSREALAEERRPSGARHCSRRSGSWWTQSSGRSSATSRCAHLSTRLAAPARRTASTRS